LLSWYDKEHRELPWRRTQDPYHIWISEIMLQQSRVAAVIGRYQQFLRRFPSVHKLASAREARVLAEWSGLGYYRRARNLHAAARIMILKHAGEFPRSVDALRSLPGIGRYTAAAVASIAFGEPVAVVDGNVERVISRLMGAPAWGKGLWLAAQTLLDQRRPGDFNQALMELGATVCVPAQPRCGDCPIHKFCRTRGRGESARRKPRQQKREITYSLARRSGAILLVRRPNHQSLMPGMWELPEAPATETGDECLFSVRHSITVTDFKVRVVSATSGRGKWVRITRLGALPLTGLTKKILRHAKLIEQKSPRGRR
jgi:A/G-specific adenine glycosylase